VRWLRDAWRRYTEDDGGPLVYMLIGLLVVALLALYLLEEFP